MDEARIRVIYADTDQMGVVYHGNYFRFFEFARGEFFRTRGRSYRELEGQGLALPVVEASCSYRSPARYEDLLVIRTRVTELRRASLTFSYELVRDTEPSRLLTTGFTTHACMTREGKPTRLPEALVALVTPSLSPAPARRS